MAVVSRPVFSGREDVQEWLSDFHWHTLSMHIVNDEARLHVFPITLKGEALDWFEDLPPERKQTWDQVKQALMEKYGKKKTPAEITAKMVRLRQDPKEEFSSFLQQFEGFGRSYRRLRMSL